VASGFSLGKFGSLLLMLAIVVVLILFTPGEILAGVKQIAGLGENSFENKEDQLAYDQKDFYAINKLYDECLKSEDKDCLCSKDNFPRLAASKNLEIKTDGIEGSILIINNIDKDNKNVNINETKIDGVITCFIKYDKNRAANNYLTLDVGYFDIVLSFDKKTVYIRKKGTSGQTDDKLKEGVASLYKYDENTICFLANDFYGTGWTWREQVKFTEEFQNKKLCETHYEENENYQFQIENGGNEKRIEIIHADESCSLGVEIFQKFGDLKGEKASLAIEFLRGKDLSGADKPFLIDCYLKEWGDEYKLDGSSEVGNFNYKDFVGSIYDASKEDNLYEDGKRIGRKLWLGSDNGGMEVYQVQTYMSSILNWCAQDQAKRLSWIAGGIRGYYEEGKDVTNYKLSYALFRNLQIWFSGC